MTTRHREKSVSVRVRENGIYMKYCLKTSSLSWAIYIASHNSG